MSAFVCGTDLNVDAQVEAFANHAPLNVLMSESASRRWLASHGFYVTASGALDKRHKQAWPLTNSTASSAPARDSV